MNTAEVDLDRLVDYEREYRSVVKRAQVTGDHMIGLCPFHDDSKNSFSVDLKTGRWHCFSEDIGGNYVDFVAKMNGISTKDAYKRIMEDYHVEMPEKEKPAASRRSYSMEQYAFEKRLPVEFLRDTCHISNDKERKDQTTYMKIPYLKEDGTEATYRKRFAGKEFRWRYGSSGRYASTENGGSRRCDRADTPAWSKESPTRRACGTWESAPSEYREPPCSSRT